MSRNISQSGDARQAESEQATASDRGLGDLTQVLQEASLEYWVDSGVLLALRRDGQLLPWEKDIDLAVTSDEVDGLLRCRAAFERTGYIVDVNRYRGRVYALGLKPGPGQPRDNLRAAVHVYYHVGRYLVSPQAQIYVPPPAPDVYTGRRSPVRRLAKAAIDRWFYTPSATTDQERVSRAPDRPTVAYRVARQVYRRLDRGLMAETWPISEIYVPLTWVVPSDLVLPLTTLPVDGRRFPVPAELDRYLSYRYGRWQEAVTDWCYWEDDGAIVRARPTAVLRRLRSAG